MDLEQNITSILSGFGDAIALNPHSRSDSRLLRDTVMSIIVACATDTMDYCTFANQMQSRDLTTLLTTDDDMNA